MPKLPPPPVPQRLREMLKDYPELIQRLQEVLDKVVQDSIGGALMPFDEAIWALEGRLESFISEARRELEVAEASGDAEAIAKAEAKKRLMFRARNSNGGMADLHSLREYFETNWGAFR